MIWWLCEDGGAATHLPEVALLVELKLPFRTSFDQAPTIPRGVLAPSASRAGDFPPLPV